MIISNPKCGVLDRERLAKMRERDFPFFLIGKNKEEARSIFLPDFPFFVIISSRYLIGNVEFWRKIGKNKEEAKSIFPTAFFSLRS